MSIDFREIIRYEISWKSVQWKLSWFMWTDKGADGRMDRYDKANSHFSQFCEPAWKVNNMAENTQESMNIM
jgi:hypothetical protein